MVFTLKNPKAIAAAAQIIPKMRTGIYSGCSLFLKA